MKLKNEKVCFLTFQLGPRKKNVYKEFFNSLDTLSLVLPAGWQSDVEHKDEFVDLTLVKNLKVSDTRTVTLYISLTT